MRNERIRIAVCDDDVHFTGDLEKMIEQAADLAGLKLSTDVFFSGEELLKSMDNGGQYELIFLDIEMKGMDGIDAARKIKERDRNILLIFVSCHEQYAQELFEVDSFRFLTKPLEKAKLWQYLVAANDEIWGMEGYYVFTFKNELFRFPIKEIVYFESDKRVIHVYLTEGRKKTFYDKLNDVEYELRGSNHDFLRIHQSFLINYVHAEYIGYDKVIVITDVGVKKELSISEERQPGIRKQAQQIGKRKMLAQSGKGRS